MPDVFWYEFRLPEKDSAKDNGMIVSSTDSRSGSSNVAVSFLVPDLDRKKLLHCNLLLRNSGLSHLAGIIFVQFYRS